MDNEINFLKINNLQNVELNDIRAKYENLSKQMNKNKLKLNQTITDLEKKLENSKKANKELTCKSKKFEFNLNQIHVEQINKLKDKILN